MKQNLLFLLSILLLVGVGCDKEEPGTQFNVNTDFVIDMKENLSPTGGTLLFKARTVNNKIVWIQVLILGLVEILRK